MKPEEIMSEWVHVRVTPRTKLAFERCARRQKATPGGVARQLIEEYVKSHGSRSITK